MHHLGLIMKGIKDFQRYKTAYLGISRIWPLKGNQGEMSCLQSFKEMVAMCLVKDPSKRPTAEKLLKHSFFKHAKAADYITRTILDPLPPLWERVRDVKVIYISNSHFNSYNICDALPFICDKKFFTRGK
jgi:serine/threonine protein kinase